MRRVEAARRAGVIESLESRLLMTTLYWDPSATAGLQSGSGTWSTAATNWNTQADGLGTRVVWTNGADAVFPTSGTSTITISGGVSANSVTFSGTGYTVTASTLTMTGTTITANQDATINSIVAGSAGVVSNGSAELTFGGANTYTGGTTLSGGGALSINSDARLGGVPGSPATNVTFSGNATLRITGAITVNANRNIAINSSVTGTIENSAAVTVAGVISGSGALGKSGAAVLTLSGTNSYSGGTVINDGVLSVNNDARLGTAPGSPTTNITFSGDGTLRFGAAVTLNSNRSISIASGKTATIDTQASNSSYAGAISGSGNFIKDGGGDLALSGTNTYGGTSRIDGGSITVSGGSALPDTTALTNATAVNATLILNASETIGSMQGPGYIQLGSYALTTGGDNTSTTFSGTASGTGGSIVKTGSGTFSLTGVNTYTGGTTVNGGTLAIDTNSSLGANPGSPTTNLTFSGTSTLKILGGLNINANRTISIANGVTATFDTQNFGVSILGVVSGSGALGKSGISVLTLTSTSNTYSGGTVLNAGTISVSADGCLGTAPGSPTTNISFNDDSTLRFAAAFTLSTNRSITIASTKTATLDLQSFNVSYAGAIGGAGNLIKDGGGDLSLSGTNTYGGTTNINGGSIIVSGGSALPDTTDITNAVAVNATLTLNGNETIGSIAGPGYIQLNSYTLTTGGSGASTTFSGAISGTGILAKAGSGSMIINNTLNSYSGGTQINGGTLQFNSNAALGANPGSPTVNITFTGNGTLLYGGAVSLNANRNIQVNSSVTGTIDVDNNNVTIGSVISGSGSIIKAGTSTLTLSNTNTFTGTTRIAAGQLKLSSSTALQNSTLDMDGSDSGSLSFGSLTSATFGGLQGSRNIALTNTSSAAVATTVGGNNNSTTYSGVLSGTSASLTKTGTGTLVLSGANTYTGATTISTGKLQLGSGGTSGSIANTSGITNNATLVTNRSDSLTISTVISGTGAVTQAGTGTLILTGTNTYSGVTTIVGDTYSISSGVKTIIPAGTLQIGSGGTSGSISNTSSVVNDGTFAYNRSDNPSFSIVISGLGDFVKQGSGTLTLSGANTFTGTTRIAAGTLTLGSSTTIQYSTLDMNGSDSGSLSFGSQTSTTLGGLQGSRNLVLSNTTPAAVALTVGGSNAAQNIYTGVLSGLGSLTKVGTGILALGQNNTYSGNTTISAGTLQIGNGGTTGSYGGTLSNSGVLAYKRSDSVTLSGVLSGSGGLRQMGSGTLILTGANTYSGTTTIDAGTTLQIGNGGTTGSIATNSTNDILDNGTLAFNRSDAVTFSNQIRGSGNLIQQGSSTLTISGTNNSFRGTTRIASGTLTIGAQAALQDSILDLNGSDSGTFSFGTQTAAYIGGLQGSRNLALTNTTPAAVALKVGGQNAATTTYSGVLSGSGSLTKTGTGVLTLSGTNTYTGGTTVGTGSLVVSGSIAGGYALTVSPQASFNTTGTSVLSTANLSLGSGSNYYAQVNTTTAGSGYDQLSVTGTVSLSGANLVLTGTRSAGTGTIILIDNDSSDAVTGEFNGIADGSRVYINGVPYIIDYQGGTGNDVVLTDDSSTTNPTTLSMAAGGQVTIVYNGNTIMNGNGLTVKYWLADQIQHTFSSPSVNTGTKTLTYSDANANVTVQFSLEFNRVRIAVNATNNSVQNMLGWEVDLGRSIMPGDPIPMNDGPITSFGIEGPSLTNYVWSSGKACVVSEDQSIPLAIKLYHDDSGGHNENYRRITISSRNTDSFQGSPLFDTTVASSGSQAVQVTYRFDQTDPQDILDKYTTAHPYTFQATDRRPVLPYFFEPNDDHVGEDNTLPDVNEVITKLQSGNYRGLVVWDFGGISNDPGKYRYDGSPDLLPLLKPNRDRQIDAWFQAIRDAGFEVGMTIRPDQLSFVTNDSYTVSDAGMTTQDMTDLLIAKATYANTRWGATLFYVDSNSAYWAHDQMEDAQAAVSGATFMAENKATGTYSSSAPYYKIYSNGTDNLDSILAAVRFARENMYSNASATVWTDDDSRVGDLLTADPTALGKLIELARLGCTLMGRNTEVINYVYQQAALH